MAQTWTVRGVATTTMRKDGLLSIYYHGTEVVRVEKNGAITLNHGGWMSNTTKLRMNQASNQYRLGYQVFQKNGRWFVRWQKDNTTVEFGGGSSREHVILRAA